MKKDKNPFRKWYGSNSKERQRQSYFGTLLPKRVLRLTDGSGKTVCVVDVDEKQFM